MKIVTVKWIKYWEGQKGHGVIAVKDEDVKGTDIWFYLEPDTLGIISKTEKWWFFEPSIERTDFDEQYINLMAQLARNGFTFDEKAQKEFDYWGKRYADKLAKLAEERELQRKKEEEPLKALAEKGKVVEWCDNHGCKTSSLECRKCNRYYAIGCRPTLAKAN